MRPDRISKRSYRVPQVRHAYIRTYPKTLKKISGVQIYLNFERRVLQKPSQIEAKADRRIISRHLEAIGRRLGVGSDDIPHRSKRSTDRSSLLDDPFSAALFPLVSAARPLLSDFKLFSIFASLLAEQSRREFLLIRRCTPTHLDYIIGTIPPASDQRGPLSAIYRD